MTRASVDNPLGVSDGCSHEPAVGEHSPSRGLASPEPRSCPGCLAGRTDGWWDVVPLSTSISAPLVSSGSRTRDRHRRAAA